MAHGEHWSSSKFVELRTSRGEILTELLASIAGDRQGTEQEVIKHKDLRWQAELWKQILALAGAETAPASKRTPTEPIQRVMLHSLSFHWPLGL